MTKFLLIASRPRCGTHFLRTAIAGVPGVSSFPEPFHPHAIAARAEGSWDFLRPPAEWLETFAQSETCCFAVHWHQRIGWGGTLALIRHLPLQVIVLYRADLLAQYVSAMEAERRDHWSCDAMPDQQPAPLTIDCDAFHTWCALQRLSVTDDFQFWGRDNCWPLRYEDLVWQWSVELAALGAWCGLDLSAARTTQHQQRAIPLQRIVTNYQQARRVADRHPCLL